MRCLVVLLALLVIAPLIAAGPVTAVTDEMTGEEAAPMVPIPPPGGDREYEVLWDLTHGVYLGYEPGQYYSDLVASLAAHGFTVSTTTQGVDNIDLSMYDILVINVGSAYNSPYTPSEVSAIVTFVGGGGGLLVMGDNANVWNANINPVAEAFGTTCGVAPMANQIDTFIEHPLFNNITLLEFTYGGGLSVNPPSITGAWSSDDQPAVSLVEPCQVIIVGDINFCDNSYGQLADNPIFTANVFNCLVSGGPIPVRTMSWGAIKALHR